MNTTRFLVGGVAVCGLLVATGMAQQQNQRQKPKVDVQIQTPADDAQPQGKRSAIGRLDEKTRGTSIRASKVVGMDVHNVSGKEIGDVEDLVLDGETGTIRYAALSFGGFLGLGDKFFAIPWSAFEVRRERGDDDLMLVLHASEETLKNAPGFDKDHWPNFADTAMTGTLDSHYGDRVRSGYRGNGVEVDIKERKTPRND